MDLGTGALAGGDGEDFLEDAASDLLDGLGAVEDGAGVEVHVVAHPVEEGGVGGDLDAGHGLAAIDGAAAGGEDADVASATHEAGHADGVVAGGVHEGEAGRGDGLGIVIDGGEGRLAALGKGTEAFLVDGGEAAGLVPDGGVVVDGGVMETGVVLPPADEGEELLADVAPGGTAGEEVFRAIDFRGFGEDARGAATDEFVAGKAERGVRGDAAGAVGAAAVEGEGEARDGEGGAAKRGGGREEGADGGSGGVHGAGDAAMGLDVEDAGGAVRGGEPLVADEAFDLVDLAAEAEEDPAGDVGVARDAREDTLEEAGGLVVGHGAAALVGEGDDAVHAWEVAGEVGSLEAIGDVAGDGGGAVHGGDDAEIVAGACAAVRARETLEGAGLIRASGGEGDDLGADVGVALEGAGLDVLEVDVIAGADGAACEADGLAVLADGGTVGDVAKGELVAAANVGAEGDGAVIPMEGGAGLEVGLGDGHVVLRAEPDGDLGEGDGRHAVD